MKTAVYYLLSFLMMLSSCLLMAQESTPDEKEALANEVIAKYIQAIGGKENLLNIQSLTIEGNSEGGDFGIEMPLRMHIKNPGKNKMEIAIMNQKMVRATDGEIAWAVNPFVGTGEARQIPQFESDKRNNVLYTFAKNLIDYKERGYKATYLGKISYKGNKVHHLRLSAELSEDEYYIDARTYYLLMAKVDFNKNFYDDYKKVGSILFPHSIETEKDDFHIKVERVILNDTIDDAEFMMPFTRFNTEEHILLNRHIEDETFEISQEEDLDATQLAQQCLNKMGHPLYFKSAKSIQAQGKITTGSIEVPFKMYQLKPNKIRIETTLLDKLFVRASNGKKAWEIDPFEGDGEPFSLDISELQEQFDMLDFGQDLAAFQTQENELEYLGEASVKGNLCYVLKLTTEDSYEETIYFIEKSTSFLRLKHEKASGEQTFYDNYKTLENKPNEYVPHLIEQIQPYREAHKIIEFESFIFDEKLDKKLFEWVKK